MFRIATHRRQTAFGHARSAAKWVWLWVVPDAWLTAKTTSGIGMELRARLNRSLAAAATSLCALAVVAGTLLACSMPMPTPLVSDASGLLSPAQALNIS
jgi:hypothetical protein